MRRQKSEENCSEEAFAEEVVDLEADPPEI